MEILLDAVGIDHAVVAQGHAALAVEERHVAVEFQKLPADGFARHFQMLHRPAAHRCSRMISSSSASSLTRYSTLSGRTRRCENWPASAVLQAPKQLARVTRTCSAVKTGGAELFGQHFVERSRPLPTAADAAADQNFVRGELLDRAVEHVLQHRLALLHVLGEDRVDQLPVDLLVLDRHLAGHHHADDRLAAATAGAAGLMEHDVVAAGGGDVLAELVEHLVAAGGVFAGGRADLDADRARRPPAAGASLRPS